MPKVTETIVDPAISAAEETPQVGETQLDDESPDAEMTEGGTMCPSGPCVSPMKSGRHEIQNFDELPFL